MRAGPFVLIGFLLAGCAVPHPDSAPYERARAERMFESAYSDIYDKYIEPVQATGFAYHGIEGLHSIDPDISVQRKGDVIHLAYAGTGIGKFVQPAGDDIPDWSRLTVNAIDAARRVSPALHDARAEAIYKAVLDQALSGFDRHSRYAGLRSARAYRAQREGFGGIGVHLIGDDDVFRIISILPGTPAARSALRAGDIITRVNGVDLDGRSMNDVTWMLRGEVGTRARLTVRREDSATPIDITLKRALIVPATVYVKRKGPIAIIRVTSFNQGTTHDLDRALERLVDGWSPPHGLVLDLRGNPGGLLDQAVSVANAFLTRGRIVTTRGRNPESVQLFNASAPDLTHGLPIAVLINGQSASAAEIVAAALQDQHRAVIIGSNSYGKGTVQNITRMPNDGELILTWSRFHAPSGYALDGLGVLPNICTSTDTGPGQDSAAAIDRKSVESTILLAAWRTLDAYDAQRRATLRARCPRQNTKPARDLVTAEHLLADRSLYARAAGDVPSIARSGTEREAMH